MSVWVCVKVWFLSLAELASLFLISNAQPPCEYGNIRLAGGSTRFEGRIEVCLNNEWGTVCDDALLTSQTRVNNFGRVVCRQLGLTSSGGFLTTRDTTTTTESIAGGVASDSVPIHFDDVVCTGDERGLIDCTHRGAGVHDCSHTEDTGIRCSPACVGNAIRLLNGDTYNSGRVELCYKGSWNTVSDLTPEAANVICGQLGFSNTGTTTNSFGPGFGNTASIDCKGNKPEYETCQINRIGSYNHSLDSGVVCGRCVDHCGPDPTLEGCLVSTNAHTKPTSTVQESTSSAFEGYLVTTTAHTKPTLISTVQESTGSAFEGYLVTTTIHSKPKSTVQESTSSALGVLLGIMVVIQIGLIAGWTTSCIHMRNKMKGEYAFNISTPRTDAVEMVRVPRANENSNITSSPVVAVSDDLSINENYGQSLPVYESFYQEIEQSTHFTDENNYAIVVQAPGSPEIHIQNPLYGEVDSAEENVHANYNN